MALTQFVIDIDRSRNDRCDQELVESLAKLEAAAKQILDWKSQFEASFASTPDPLKDSCYYAGRLESVTEMAQSLVDRLNSMSSPSTLTAEEGNPRTLSTSNELSVPITMSAVRHNVFGYL